MKKIIFLIIVSLTLSCNNSDSTQKVSNESETLKFQNAWLNADLNDVFTSIQVNKTSNTTKAYVFSKADLIQLLNSGSFNKFKFVLGLTNNNLDVKVNVHSNNESISLNSEIYSDENLETQLNYLNGSDYVYVSENNGINNYFLNNDTAYNQYENLVNINNVSVLENVVSYNGERIKHFSIEKQVIEELINNVNFNKLAVILAVNQSGKLSPIIVGLNQSNNFVSNTYTNSKVTTGTIVIGGTNPCPSCCDKD